MENNNEQLGMKLRSGQRGIAVALVICMTSLMRVMKHSEIRTVDIISLMASGASIGALITILAISYKLKKMNGTK